MAGMAFPATRLKRASAWTGVELCFASFKSIINSSWATKLDANHNNICPDSHKQSELLVRALSQQLSSMCLYPYSSAQVQDLRLVVWGQVGLCADCHCLQEAILPGHLGLGQRAHAMLRSQLCSGAQVQGRGTDGNPSSADVTMS